MTVKDRLNEKVHPYRLLEHPFYQQWNEGTLTQDDLALYAQAYGIFIQTIPQGWQALGDRETVTEELEHNQLWDQFASALGTEVSPSDIPQIEALINLSAELFADQAAAIGALYAFEVQQPETADTKLSGLREHYNLPETSERYFIEHANNHHEAEKLLVRVAALSPQDQTAAVNACQRMSAALWDSLTGILEARSLN